KHDGCGAIEQHDDASRDGWRVVDSVAPQCVGKPGLETLLVRGAGLERGMSGRARKFSRGALKAATFPSCRVGRAGKFVEQAPDLVGRRSRRLVEPARVEIKRRLVARGQVGRDQVVLAAEVVIQRLLGDAGLLGNGVDAGCANTLIIEKAGGGGDDALAGLFGVGRHVRYVYCLVSIYNLRPGYDVRSTNRSDTGSKMSELVLRETRGAVAILTLNRPEKLNALNYALVDRIKEQLDTIEGDPALRAVILTGAGDRAFSAGADITEFSQTMREGPDAAVRAFVRRGQSMTARIEAFPKPVIVAVNGIAFGGGCEITEAAHLAVASERAVFAKPEINIGIPPTFGGTQRLPRLAGRKRALELLLTGDVFSVERAYEIGLVNRIVAHDDLLPASLELADRILRHSSLT